MTATPLKVNAHISSWFNASKKIITNVSLYDLEDEAVDGCYGLNENEVDPYLESIQKDYEIVARINSMTRFDVTQSLQNLDEHETRDFLHITVKRTSKDTFDIYNGETFIMSADLELASSLMFVSVNNTQRSDNA